MPDAKPTTRPAEPKAETAQTWTLADTRGRHAGSAVFSILLGALLIWKLGSVGLVLGGALLVYGALEVWRLVRVVRHPPGAFRIDATSAGRKQWGGEVAVTLPRGLATGEVTALPISQLRHVYLLRAAAPMGAAAPVLVVETADAELQFPRDWWRSESDQREVYAELNRRLGRVS